MKNRRSRDRVLLAVSAGMVTLAAGVVMAEDLFIQQDRVDLTEEPNPYSAIVQTVPRDTKVQALNREDNWVKVQTPQAIQGYVTEDALSKTEIAVAGNSNAPLHLDETLASKGNLAGEALTYSKDRNYNAEPLKKILKLETGSSELGKRFDQFCKEGHVGKYKGK